MENVSVAEAGDAESRASEEAQLLRNEEQAGMTVAAARDARNDRASRLTEREPSPSVSDPASGPMKPSGELEGHGDAEPAPEAVPPAGGVQYEVHDDYNSPSWISSQIPQEGHQPTSPMKVPGSTAQAPQMPTAAGPGIASPGTSPEQQYYAAQAGAGYMPYYQGGAMPAQQVGVPFGFVRPGVPMQQGVHPAYQSQEAMVSTQEFLTTT